MPSTDKTTEAAIATEDDLQNNNVVPPKLPEWINAEFFAETLHKQFGPSNYKILKFKPIAAFGAGENYASEMLRVEIELEQEDKRIENVSYILKSLPTNEISADLIIKMDLFPKEMEMYESIIPQFEALFVANGQSVTFGPKCWKISHEPKAIIMEDLKEKEFRNAKRLIGLDFVHTQCALKKLAQFHAASACFYEQNGPYSEAFINGLCTEEIFEIFETMNKASCQIYRDCMLKWPTGKLYVDKIKDIQATYIDRFTEASQVNHEHFNVLNHGDLWCNNIMFQYNDDGSIKETYFVDYQISKYGSPAQDLYYFLLSSVSPDIKLKDFDYFIKYYHENLIENLKILNYPKKLPTLRDIHITLLTNTFWGIGTAIGVLTAVLLDPSANAKLENFGANNDEGVNFKITAYTNPRYVSVMEKLLPWLENRGILE